MSTQATQVRVDPKQFTPRPELLPRRSTEQWKKQDEVLVQHLNNLFSPLQFPPELASRILTHASHPDATRRHNARLSFVGKYIYLKYLVIHHTLSLRDGDAYLRVGRRVLQSYLLMFVHSSSALRPEHDYEKFITHALNTYTLGEHVAPRWELGKVIKWKPMNVGSLSRPLGPDEDVPSPFADVKADNARSIGMYKVHGTTVEAVVGGVFHQFVRIFKLWTVPWLMQTRVACRVELSHIVSSTLDYSLTCV